MDFGGPLPPKATFSKKTARKCTFQPKTAVKVTFQPRVWPAKKKTFSKKPKILKEPRLTSCWRRLLYNNSLCTFRGCHRVCEPDGAHNLPGGPAGAAIVVEHVIIAASRPGDRGRRAADSSSQHEPDAPRERHQCAFGMLCIEARKDKQSLTTMR